MGLFVDTRQTAEVSNAVVGATFAEILGALLQYAFDRKLMNNANATSVVAWRQCRKVPSHGR